MERPIADMIMTSSCVFTANTLEPMEGGVAIKGDTIVAVGARGEMDAFCGPQTEVVDFGDATIAPGFNDSHLHFSFAAAQNDPDFCVVVLDCETKEQSIARIAAFADTHPANPWVYGFGWGAVPWEVETPPTRHDLDAVCADRPVCITHFSGHTTWCNTKALELAGITSETPDPEGGTIVRDEVGEPTGWLLEHPASHLVADLALNLPDLPSSLRKLMRQFAEHGVTSVGDVFPHEVTNDVYATYAAMERAGEMTLRITFFPSLLDVPRAAELRDAYHSDWVRVGGVKQLMDGILEAGTAWMIEPYVDSPDHFGEPILSEGQFEELVDAADAAGLPVRVHCIGDATARMVIDVHERVQERHGKKGLRHCLEHLETAQDMDIRRMQALDLCASVQPLHSVYGNNASFYEQYIGRERARHTWRFADMLEAGVHMGLSTDFPAAASSDPMQVLQAAVTRCLPDGSHVEDYQVDQVLTMGQALQGMTRGSAYVESFETRVGTLAEGMLADIVVMDRDLFAIEDPFTIQDAKPQLTMVGGKVVYCA